MRQTTHKDIQIRDLYQNIPDKPITVGDRRYLGSLTPTWEILKKIKKITFNVTLNNHDKYTLKKVNHDNEVNSHIFKPAFYFQDAEHLTCFVSNKEVLAHTAKSLRVATRFACNESLLLDIHEYTEDYLDYTRNWRIEDEVIICRLESFITFLRLLWLIENGVNIDSVREYAIACDMARLETNTNPLKLEKLIEEKYSNIRFSQFEESYKIEWQPADSPYINSVNVEYHGKKITLIQLTWGISLAESQLRAILSVNPNIKKIGFIGGVGYSETDGSLEVDDVFVPTSIVIQNKDGGHQVVQLNNDVIEQKENKIFNSKKVGFGSIKTVVPRLGIFSNTATFKDSVSLISAFDMEMEGFWNELLKHPHVKTAMMYYVMDLPFSGVGLGDTYYNIDYLRTLFKSFERGKYHCFEKVLSFICSK